MKNDYFKMDVLKVLTFLTFCMSTVFMIFISTVILEVGPKPWNKILVLIACFLPLFLMLVSKIKEQNNRHIKFNKERLFIFLILLLGFLNIVFSEDRTTTLKIMTLFLASGVGVYSITKSVFESKKMQIIFLWLCWISLIVLCLYGIYEHLFNESILLLYYNPIIASAIILLLLPGPFALLCGSSRWLQIFQLLTILCCIILIVMIGKRGAVLGLIGMAFTFGLLIPGRKSWVALLVAIIFIFIGYNARDYLPWRLTQNVFSDVSVKERLENYPFALHIFMKKPILGVGLHAPLSKYMSGYKLKTNLDRDSYLNFIKKMYTLENVVLCAFVETGGLFAITYIAFIFYLSKKFFIATKKSKEKRIQAVLLLLPIVGFCVQAMTFDGLINGHLNWMFHSYLGMMTNFD